MSALWLGLLSLTAAELPFISEFVARNATSLADETDDYHGWIEIHNPAATPVSMDGWTLTDNARKPSKWRFPAAVIAAGGHLVVFASGDDRRDPAGTLHTNFKLDEEDGYLALAPSNGAPVSVFKNYPAQLVDVAYGAVSAGGDTSVPPLRGSRWNLESTLNSETLAAWRTDSFPDTAWPAQDPKTWTFPTRKPAPGGDPSAAQMTVADSVLIRVPFTTTNATGIEALRLNLACSNTVVVWLNGQRVAGRRVFDNNDRRRFRTAEPTRAASGPVSFDLTAFRGKLREGTNLFAIQIGVGVRELLAGSVHCQPEILIRRVGRYDTAHPHYLSPSPGISNPGEPTPTAPAIRELKTVGIKPPGQPAPTNPLPVVTRIVNTGAGVKSVTLHWRTDFGPVRTLPMLDDGRHADGAAGDGIYGALIPGAALTPGTLVRWYVSAESAAGQRGREPAFAAPDRTPEFVGTVVGDTVTSKLPVFRWFADEPEQARTDQGTRCAVFHLGELYDNVHVSVKGQFSRQFPKNSFKFRFLPGHRFRHSPDFPKVEKFNLQNTYADKAYVRIPLAYEAYTQGGTPAPHAAQWHVRLNGEFHSLATFVEEPDKRWLERVGLDPEGALYKMNNTLRTSRWNVEKRTRKHEDSSDLEELVDGVSPGNPDRGTWIWDHVNIPAAINYMAVANAAVADADWGHKNYLVYCDSRGTKEWTFLPWDKDLTFGRYYTYGTVLNDVITARQSPFSSHNNSLATLLYTDARTRPLYLRRLRTIMDQQLQAPGTPGDQLRLERRIHELVASEAREVALDRRLWFDRYPWGSSQSWGQALFQLTNRFIAQRRLYLYGSPADDGERFIPGPQPTNAAIQFGRSETVPGRPAEDWLALTNPGREAVDISGWTLDGAVQYRFQPGVVIGAGATLYVSPNVNAFRARSRPPRGGAGNFVQGPYQGALGAGDGMVRLKSDAGRAVASVRTGG